MLRVSKENVLSKYLKLKIILVGSISVMKMVHLTLSFKALIAKIRIFSLNFKSQKMSRLIFPSKNQIPFMIKVAIFE